MPTLADLAAADSRLARVAEDASRQGLVVRGLLGAGGYAAAFEAMSPRHGPCVLKVPCLPGAPPPDGETGSGPHRVTQVSETGPFVLTGPRSLDEASALLERACRRQRETGCGRPLAVLLETLSLDDRPAALFERAPGVSLRSLMAEAPDEARAAIPCVARALSRLHEVFGGHGDLKPEHIFVGNGEVVFIDPLDIEDQWVGSLGYVLPCVWWHGEDTAVLRDLTGVAAVLAEAWGGNVGWDGGLVHRLLNYLADADLAGCAGADVPERMKAGLRPAPPSLRQWILDAAAAALGTYNLAEPEPPRELEWSRGRLEALAQGYPRFLPEWRTPAVVGLARQIFEDRAEELYPVLADALQDAGCDNEELLGGCRCSGAADREWITALAAGPSAGSVRG
jgi:hypothetical protein